MVIMFTLPSQCEGQTRCWNWRKGALLGRQEIPSRSQRSQSVASSFIHSSITANDIVVVVVLAWFLMACSGSVRAVGSLCVCHLRSDAGAVSALLGTSLQRRRVTDWWLGDCSDDDCCDFESKYFLTLVLWLWLTAGEGGRAPGLFSQITASKRHFCGVLVDGSLHCWGACPSFLLCSDVMSNVECFCYTIVIVIVCCSLCFSRFYSSSFFSSLLLSYLCVTGPMKFLVPDHSAHRFVQIVCSDDHCCALTDKGQSVG